MPKSCALYTHMSNETAMLDQCYALSIAQ